MNDYEKYIFHNIETKTKLDVWYVIDSKRSDLQDFVEAIKKRIDLHEDCEFNSDYTKFKRVMTYDETIEYFNNNKLNNIKEKK
jgi:AICAR transformylase/IMP cyclohydrolase PurH